MTTKKPSKASDSETVQSIYLDLESWIGVFNKESWLIEDQDLLLKGLQEHPEWANQTDRFQRTPLIKASNCSCVEVIKELIKAGADLNLQDQWGRTALMVASDRNKMEIVQVLNQAGANVNIQDKDGVTALMRASIRDNWELVRDLMNHGADPWTMNKNGETALDWAKKKGCEMIVSLLEAHSVSQALSQAVRLNEASSVLNPFKETDSLPSSKGLRL